MNILHLIASDSFITVNKELIKVVGLEAAVLIGELASEHNYWTQNKGITSDGYFFSTIENMEEKTSLSGHQQRQALKKLEEIGVVTVKIMGLPAKRYVKLHDEQVLKIFKTKDLNNLSAIDKENKELDIKNFNRNNNINNNNIINNNINNGETSSPSVKESDILEITEEQRLSEGEVVEPSTPLKEKPKKQSLKDQLLEYVASLSYSSETKDYLLKWIFNIGLPKNVRLQQLQDMLKDLWDKCNNESVFTETIKQSYLRGWFGFYPPNNKPTTYKTPAQPVQSPSTPPKKVIEAYTPSIEEMRAIANLDIKPDFTNIIY